jgi:hypothetical protein
MLSTCYHMTLSHAVYELNSRGTPKRKNNNINNQYYLFKHIENNSKEV